MRRIALEEDLCSAEKIAVPLKGSGNGVDATGRFNPSRLTSTAREEVRRSLGIPEDAVVLGYVGRLVRDKGIAELVGAWQRLRERHPLLYLLIVGPFEPQDPLPSETVALLQSDRRIHLTGRNRNTPPLYAAMDVVVLPSFREGFPNVPLEAAAMALPVIAYRIPGCVDAIVEGVTGKLVPTGDVDALMAAAHEYIEDEGLRKRHGMAGRERVLREFRPESIWQAVHEEYVRLLRMRSLGGRAAERARRRRLEGIIKAALDPVIAGVLLLLLFPLLIVIGLLIKLDDGGPVFFRQERVGRGERLFRVWKFRTMVPNADELLTDSGSGSDGRITKIGKLLRRLSLDELPQLINVLIGQMAIVGPRPIVREHLPRYTAWQRRRFLVKPGITGLAQVSGRNMITWSRRLELDVAYVESFSLWLDLRLILKSLPVVVLQRGIVLDRNPEFADDLPGGSR